MMKEASLCRIDEIITSQLQCLPETVGKVRSMFWNSKNIDISVFFEKVSLDSLTSGDDWSLFMFGAFAEQEARDISTKLKWIYKNKFKEGNVYLNTIRFLVFIKDEKYIGDAILRKIFSVDFLSKRQKNERRVNNAELNDCLPCITPKTYGTV